MSGPSSAVGRVAVDPPGAGGPPRAGAAGIAAFAVALALYLATAHRAVGCHDQAEFQTLAATGGIAHAGYPALVMVLQAFGHLPLSTLPFRANLVSVLAGALVVGLAAWSGARLAGSARAGFFAALALALSLTFWREATQAGVHVFTLALGVPLFLLCVRLAGRPSWSTALAIGLLAGLGLVSHLTILALLPVAALAIVRAARAGTLRPAHLAWMALGLAIGLTPIGYLIAHDRPDQPMNYLHDTLRPDNAAALSGGTPPSGRVSRALWLLSARQYLGGFVFSPFGHLPVRLALLGSGALLNDLPLVGLALAGYGALVLVRRRDPMAPFLAAWLLGALFWLLYAAAPLMVHIFFLPGLWVASQAIAAALGALSSRSRGAGFAAALLLVLAPLARLAIAAPPAPLARSGLLRAVWHEAPADWSPFVADTTWQAYGRGVMAALPPRAVVLVCWEEATTLRYFRYAEPLRRDVDILYHCRVPQPAFAAADSARRPIFTTYEPTLAMTGGRPFHRVARWPRGGLWRIE